MTGVLKTVMNDLLPATAIWIRLEAWDSREKRGRFMCDYSVMMVPNRLAIEGEELVTHRFQSGSIGLVSCFDYDTWSNKRATSIWQKLKALCSFGSEPTPAVCIPPGARLRLEGSPKTFKEQFTLGSSEEATFVQLSVEINQHRDALCFDNSAIVLLQLLPEGQRIRVLRLSSHEDFQSELDGLQVIHAAGRPRRK